MCYSHRCLYPEFDCYWIYYEYLPVNLSLCPSARSCLQGLIPLADSCANSAITLLKGHPVSANLIPYKIEIISTAYRVSRRNQPTAKCIWELTLTPLSQAWAFLLLMTAHLDKHCLHVHFLPTFARNPHGIPSLIKTWGNCSHELLLFRRALDKTLCMCGITSRPMGKMVHPFQTLGATFRIRLLKEECFCIFLLHICHACTPRILQKKSFEVCQKHVSASWSLFL